jgi:hypothetical protein
MLASIKSTNINTQQINSTQSTKYKTDKLNKAKIIKKTETKQKSLKWGVKIERKKSLNQLQPSQGSKVVRKCWNKKLHPINKTSWYSSVTKLPDSR